jgi:NAD+ diphosphatase
MAKDRRKIMNANDIQPFFSRGCIDRMDYLRADIFTQPRCATDRYLLLVQGSVLLNCDGECFLSAAELPVKLLDEALCVFLGGDKAGHYFALSVAPEQAEEYQAVPLREFFLQQSMTDAQVSLLAEANSLLSWHHSHAFCARCGRQSVPTYGGWRRDCPNCATKHFPRTDPVVIMLVTCGEQCLLGRSHHFAAQYFSCLAGFMEPGETIEQAALRELWEEAGIKGDKVSYLFDQPWPFPANLMLGVHIKVDDIVLNIDNQELEQAIWVSKADVNAVLSGNTDKGFLLSPKIAIARNLLQYWVTN